MLSEFNTFCGQYENIIKAFGALAPFFGTVFLAYIAYQQWQTNERQRRKELFEMRYENLYKNSEDMIEKFFNAINTASDFDLEPNEKENKINAIFTEINSQINQFKKYDFLLKRHDSKIFQKYLNEIADEFNKLIESLSNENKNYANTNEIYNLRQKIFLILEPYIRIEL